MASDTDVRVSREDFIKIATGSKCSEKLTEVLQGKAKNDIEEYKGKVFGMIYDSIGQDMNLATNLESALLVKNTKYAPWQVCLLNCFTCGLFSIFRSRDDDAVLVLTKQGRVITLKMERRPCIEGTTLEVVVMCAKYLMMLVVALSLPSLIMWVLLSGHAHTKSFKDKYGLQEVDRLQIDFDMLEKIKRHYVIGAETFVAVLIVLLLYLWTKCPAEYGNRYRESYSANTCSAGQFCITGTKARQQVVMRLYFGKYPSQAMLDTHGVVAPSRGSVCQVLPLSSLAGAGSTGGGSRDASRLTKPSAGATATGLVVLLSVVTMLDTTLAWFDRAMAASELVKVSQFCREAPGPEDTNATQYCTPNVCQKWAVEQGHPESFCKNVKWHDKTTSSQLATCLYYGYDSTPCCGGCGMGEMYAGAKAGGWLSSLQEMLGIIADIGTVVFSVMAATAAVAVESTADHFDVTINRTWGNDALEVDSRFDFTYPATQDFFESVYRKHRMPKDDVEGVAAVVSNFMKILNHGGTTQAGLVSTESEPLTHNDVEDDDVAEAGVTMYEKDSKHNDWVDFFEYNSLTKVVKGHLSSDKKVVVPVKCLGIVDAEQFPRDPRAEHVVAAWTESPRMLLSRLVVPICAAAILMFFLLVAPESLSEDPIVLPGLPKESPLSRAITALILGGGVILAGLTCNYISVFVNGVTHAVIVTDQRLFYVRHQPPCVFLLNFGMSLRIDVFRHDRGVTYGRVEGLHRSFFQRLTCSHILPGTVTLKCKFGILELRRQFGNVWNVFHVVQQLVSESTGDLLQKGFDENDSAWNWDQGQADAELKLEAISSGGRKHHGIRHIKAQPTDLMSMGPGLYLMTKREGDEVKEVEQPLFHWSIRLFGASSSAFNTSQDIVVTTGRVYIWNRSQYKQFDCKTALMWGTCWCGWLSAVVRAETLPNTMSFFCLGDLLSFCTNTSVKPPQWSDPVNGPVKVPLWEKFCQCMTMCMTCSTKPPENLLQDEDVEEASYSLIPRRRAPLIHLYMMWRLKTGPQQADLICSVFPFRHKDFDDVDLLDSLGCCGAAKKEKDTVTYHSKKMVELRAIMGVAQDAAEGLAGVR